MQLFLNTADFNWDDTLPLADAAGRTCCSITCDPYAPERRLFVLDLSGTYHLQLQQRIPSLTPCYELEIYGLPSGRIYRSPEGAVLLPAGLQAVRAGDLIRIFSVEDTPAGGTAQLQHDSLWMLTLPGSRSSEQLALLICTLLLFP